MSLNPTLIVVTGATGSGKTALSIAIAQRLGCHILSADSRQLYRDIPIGTAAPTADELAAVPHHFVGARLAQAVKPLPKFDISQFQSLQTTPELKDLFATMQR